MLYESINFHELLGREIVIIHGILFLCKHEYPYFYGDRKVEEWGKIG
jgi:hypothetical protein